MASKKPDPLKPSIPLLVKLASLVVHADEYMDEKKRHFFDKIAFDTLMRDPEVLEWSRQMAEAGLLPVKRS
jgi:hypothetical protein